MEKAKPVATIIRECLTDNLVWIKGLSVTYQDTSYTKTTATKRWAAKHFRLMTDATCERVRTDLSTRLGSEYDVHAYEDVVAVYKKWPIKMEDA